ncbi:MAG: molecular chaperone DnaK, partial [Candidatus Eisenbacteria bacterium]|nr:molecular chaperone DnaK [Candidatus Eisenbacteria bacterium]
LANLERLPAESKVELGRLLLPKLEKGTPDRQILWALGRVGARQPFYGPVDRAVPPGEVAGWIDSVLTLPLEETSGTAQALVALGRTTGDRARDLPASVVETIAARFEGWEEAAHWTSLLRDPHASLVQSEQEWLFGDRLPTGLILRDAAP